MNEKVTKEQNKLPNKTKPNTPQLAMSKLPLIISIVAIVIAVIFGFYNHSADNDYQTSLNTLQNKVTRLSTATRQMSELNQIIKSQETKLISLSNDIGNANSTTQQLQQQLTKMSQISGRNDKEWVLAETEYLIRLANFNINLEKRPQLAIKILQNANNRLSSLHDPSLVKIQRVLVNDITELQAVPTVDYTGMILKMDALAKSADKLPIATPHLINDNEKNNPESSQKSSGWRKSVNEVFEKLVVIRHYDKPIEPLLSAEQQIYVIQNIQLMLQQTQWALLNRQQNLYDANLIRVEQWINRYFDKNEQRTKSFLTTVAQLKAINIDPQLPDISNSLTTIKQIIHDETKENKG